METVSDLATADGPFDAEGRGGQIHGPKHHSGGIGIEALGGEDAVHFNVVPNQVARSRGDTKAENEGATAGPGHAVQARLSVEVVAAAGAAADGWLQAAATTWQSMAASRDDKSTRVHVDLRKVHVQGRFE